MTTVTPYWAQAAPIRNGVLSYAKLWPTAGGELDPRSYAQGQLEGIGMVMAALLTGALDDPNASLQTLLEGEVRPTLAAAIAAARAELAAETPEEPDGHDPS